MEKDENTREFWDQAAANHQVIQKEKEAKKKKKKAKCKVSKNKFYRR